ncbi:TetR/AcrR family transcriptional regulator [Geodermatophilus nigrescens]|uniref:Transcriptional regulator, TetR family n=1 Tax=Geodermatophilus nigrescens TaxID=1070870 RepID=A0A1M5SFI4_9ACTN|nr:TetR/AcrR family transcriptional regulator [Geodermatophilus nigrescens]SHH37304.1 transcriptional regulator, TetR family [Geodermatophilus nigrescens]
MTAPLRRDAERNRQRILESARRLVAETGLAASHDDIARAAGVGVGTVYRRFPRKADLLDALFGAQVAEVAALAEAARTEPDAWAALTGFLGEVLRRQAADRGLRELLTGSPHAGELARSARERIAPTVADLVRRAQEEGRMRPDAEVGDVALVPLMAGAVLAAAPGDPDLAQRALATALAGLAAGEDRDPLPGSAPDAAGIERLLGG